MIFSRRIHLRRAFSLMDMAVFFRIINTQALPALKFFTDPSSLEPFDRTVPFCLSWIHIVISCV